MSMPSTLQCHWCGYCHISKLFIGYICEMFSVLESKFCCAIDGSVGVTMLLAPGWWMSWHSHWCPWRCTVRLGVVWWPVLCVCSFTEFPYPIAAETWRCHATVWHGRGARATHVPWPSLFLHGGERNTHSRHAHDQQAAHRPLPPLFTGQGERRSAWGTLLATFYGSL